MGGRERKVEELKCAFTECGVKFLPEVGFKIPPEM